MDGKRFNEVVEAKLDTIRSVLIKKGGEYAPGDTDRLFNFKQAAGIQENTPRQALAGMMIKHTISVYQMINSDELYSEEKWDEKIIDHINYLLLLAAVVDEENSESVSATDDSDVNYKIQVNSYDPEAVARTISRKLNGNPGGVNNQGIAMTSELIERLGYYKEVDITPAETILYNGRVVSNVVRNTDTGEFNFYDESLDLINK